MKACGSIIWLELVGLVRSKTLALLTVASVVWLFVMPLVITADGTAEGARELTIRYGLGGVFALVLVSLLATATGSLAHERAARRLQLTLVRPVRYTALVLSKLTALVLAGACVLALACALLPVILKVSGCARSELCNHVFLPVLPSARAEAETMYDVFLADPSTPPEVKRAKKSVVLRLLENRARDHYQTIPTNATVSWRFETRRAWLGSDAGEKVSPAIRFRFSNMYSMRDDVVGAIEAPGFVGVVSNITQAVITVPLVSCPSARPSDGVLSFRNEGKNALMLRPRQDVELLLPADAFGWNLMRAYLELVGALTLVLAFGLFLSASLGRPVALFVALVMLLLSEMSPSVIAQYPDELETQTVDRIGLILTRFAAEVTRPVAVLNPLEKLARDTCVEAREVMRVLLLDATLVPFLLALLSAFVLPRKQDEI